MGVKRKAPKALGSFWNFETRVTEFRVWVSGRKQVELVLFSSPEKESSRISLKEEGDGYFQIESDAAAPGQLYQFLLDGEGPFPDPYSRSQPGGVHGPSMVVDACFSWTDAAWKGHSKEELIFYEVHVGTATPEGTFRALQEKLPYFNSLGVTALELMPVAAFSGTRNWGYDGVFPFAPDASYGSCDDLKRLVDAAHSHGLSVFLDVVYNHLGPDGNYLGCFGDAYYSKRYSTPWGKALDFEGEHSSPVRAWALSNAVMWISEFHFDGLRLDSVHALCDASETSIVTEIGESAKAAAPLRQVHVFGEDDMNHAMTAMPTNQGGLGLDGMWTDDFHNQMRRIWAKDTDGCFSDFQPHLEDLAKILNQGWLYEGQFSTFRGCARGTSPRVLQAQEIVHSIQNHDQIGNRALGDRLSQSVDAAAYRAMSVLLLLSPYVPLIFMGQEWGSARPFCFFTDFDKKLGEAVTRGRRQEFRKSKDFESVDVPNPQEEETFLKSKLDWAELKKPPPQGIFRLYQRLLFLRRNEPCFVHRARRSFSAHVVGDNTLLLKRTSAEDAIWVIVNVKGPMCFDLPPGVPLLWSESREYGADQEKSFLTGTRLESEGACALVWKFTSRIKAFPMTNV